MTQQPPQSPLPAAFLDPWLQDNARFIAEAQKQATRLGKLWPQKRTDLLNSGQIRTMTIVDPAAISAVDAAVATATLGDQASIIVQVVHVDPQAHATLGAPVRLSGINGYGMATLRTPARLASEFAVLARVEQLTIADTSYWSMLREVNQTISQLHGSPNDVHLKRVVDVLVKQHVFLDMLNNPNIIPMTKLSESDSLVAGISDREIYGHILQPGEFTVPTKLRDKIAGSFGIQNKPFTDTERAAIQKLFDHRLGVLFFKPHSWNRAFRIEGHLARMKDDKWLMPMLNGIAAQTIVHTIVEPHVQFMADHVSKQIAAVTALYGPNNRFRLPLSLPPIRTGEK